MHKTRRLLTGFIVLLIFSTLEIPQALAEVQTVTVGVYENMPKIFTSASGKPSGIFIDIIEQIAKTEGWKLRYVHGTWAEGLDRLAKGEIDLMPDVAYTVEREQFYSFPKVPVLFSWSQVYARKGSGIQSILDLNGKRVAALEQTIQLQTFKRLTHSFALKIILVPVHDYKTEFEMVANGKADAGVTNRYYGLMNARKFGLEDTPIMFDPASFFFAAPKDASRNLLEIIDLHLSKMKADPQSAYYGSLKRWTSEEVHFKLPAWLEYLGIVLGVVLIMSLIGSLLLRNQVTARTQELKKINETLDQKVQERTAELKQKNNELEGANEKLKEVDRLKSMFIASMSHELRTPLNSVIGYSSVILNEWLGPVCPEQKDKLAIVLRAGKHLLSLINDVIDVSKIEAGQIDVYAEEFDLFELVEDAARQLEPDMRGKGLLFSIDNAHVWLMTDRRRLLQVVLNLLSNAMKYTVEGAVRLSVTLDGQWADIAVCDTGIGISEQDAGKIFQPFVRVDSPMRVTVPGTGLGLYLSHKLATEVLNGTISFSSHLGQGSVFTIRVPAHTGNEHHNGRNHERPDC